MKSIRLIVIVYAAALALIVAPVMAQGETPTPAAQGEGDIPLVHVVQEGETLYGIALQYDTTVEILQQLNRIADPGAIFVGQQLILPGGGGEAVAIVHTVRLGETLDGLAAAYNTTVGALAAENRMVAPGGLAAGQTLAIISRTGSAEPQPLEGTAYLVQPGDTMLGLAAAHGTTPGAIAAANGLPFPTYLHAGQRLRLPGEGEYRPLPDHWRRIELTPAALEQGEAASVYVESLLPGTPNGRLAGEPLRFAPYGDGYVALAGFEVTRAPGRYTLELGGVGSEPWRPFSQDLVVAPGLYSTQTITIPESLSHLLAPEVRATEDAFLATIYDQFGEAPQWAGVFQMPVTGTVVTAPFGDMRSYNQGPIEIYHTGVDFAGVVGTPIHAPAAGTVVYSDTLELRGITLIMDHGLGVMTGLYHLSEVLVDVGDQVMAGQIVALGGDTGLSSGPHLHWDLRLNNVPVNGLAWTETAILPPVEPAAPPSP